MTTTQDKGFNEEEAEIIYPELVELATRWRGKDADDELKFLSYVFSDYPEGFKKFKTLSPSVQTQVRFFANADDTFGLYNLVSTIQDLKLEKFIGSLAYSSFEEAIRSLSERSGCTSTLFTQLGHGYLSNVGTSTANTLFLLGEAYGELLILEIAARFEQEGLLYPNHDMAAIARDWSSISNNVHPLAWTVEFYAKSRTPVSELIEYDYF